MAKKVKPQPFPSMDKDLDADTLGEIVRASRTQAGLGIHEAAAFCGVAVDTLSKIEKGRDVRLSSVFKVCKMLGLRLEVDTGESLDV